VVLVGRSVVEYGQYVIDGVVFLDVGVVDRQRGYQHHVIVIVVGGRVFVVVVVIRVTLFGRGRLDVGRGRSGLPDVGHRVRGLGHRRRRRRRRRIRRLLDGGRRVAVIHFGRNLVVGERLLMVIMMVLMLVVVTAVCGVLLHDVRHVGHRRQPVAVGLHQGSEVTEQIVRPVSVLHSRPVAVHQYGVGHRLLERQWRQVVVVRAGRRGSGRDGRGRGRALLDRGRHFYAGRKSATGAEQEHVHARPDHRTAQLRALVVEHAHAGSGSGSRRGGDRHIVLERMIVVFAGARYDSVAAKLPATG